ncbi:MAG: hypothetical protein IRZ00_09485 [Gemmatimonadetes bacterium]|nr:hypothetical protein [Gemmatimonadota bacterium]
MQLETFRGPELSRVLRDVTAARGDDALILSTRRVRGLFEVVVADAGAVERFRQRLEAEPPRKVRDGEPRPYLVAIVGPTGAGKTTTAAKLALHPRAFGGVRAGLVTLDTFRIAALEQVQTYADIAGLPLEVVYDAAEVPAALRRLAKCDVVIVDTPGRSPRAGESQEWRKLLAALDPDEVHLALPAGLRADVALAMADAFRDCGTTHLLLTKLDEVPGEDGVVELADRLGLPARWVTDGQEVPTDLRPAAARLLEALGAPAPATLRVAV